MDTRSTKFKYSLFAKGLCIFLSAVLFFSFAFFTSTVIEAIQIYGCEEYLSNSIPDFYNSYGFETKLSTDIYYIKELISGNAKTTETAFVNNQNTIIDSAVNTYLTEKAAIIENELRYAVDNYDDSYFNYEYTADAVDIPEPVTSETGSEPLTDKNGNTIPRNIEAAKKILENCKGLEFLDYQALVRDSAFDENEFHYSYTLCITDSYTYVINFSNINGYNMDESAIRKHFLIEYVEQQNNAIGDAQSHHYNTISMIENLAALKYFITDKDGKVYTNGNRITNTDELKRKAENNPVYILYDDAGLSYSGLSTHMADVVSETFSDAGNCSVYLYFDIENIDTYNDNYSYLYSTYNRMLDSSAIVNISIAAISLIASFILLVIFISLCGHRNSEDKLSTALIDRLPTDIHFIISVGSVGVLTYVGIFLALLLLESTAENFNKIYYIYGPAAIAAFFTLSYLIFAEWLSSTARIVKSGQKYFSEMLTAKAFISVGRLFRRTFISLKNAFRTLGYKPKKFRRTIILLVSGYFLGNMLITLTVCLLTSYVYGFLFAFFGIIILIAYNCVYILVFAQYIANLDKIIDASCRHESVNFGNEKVPESLRLLASNLTNTNEALEEAIQKAVRDEQMKTELITNVSHDLKTPLTSLISYSDLLEKCNIEDETAQKYIGVIHTQSIKLKRLIEDLIEASKVSTGNVTINATKLNLSELAMQVIAEFSPEMEKNGNEIRFSEPEIPPTVFADGSKTYRILSNLLSNAKKYSAPDTRVYVSVFTDNVNSYFEIKNVSAEPLNISPEELTERFVRGDKSRSKEGNGLGLSIAKDLCTLQNGVLELCIDGDLFKARVTLPA